MKNRPASAGPTYLYAVSEYEKENLLNAVAFVHRAFANEPENAQKSFLEKLFLLKSRLPNIITTPYSSEKKSASQGCLIPFTTVPKQAGF